MYAGLHWNQLSSLLQPSSHITLHNLFRCEKKSAAPAFFGFVFLLPDSAKMNAN
jgi:hypothetical protein